MLLTPMIQSIRHKGFRKIFETGSAAGVVASRAKRLRTQLTTLDTAQVIADMDIPGSGTPAQGADEKRVVNFSKRQPAADV